MLMFRGVLVASLLLPSWAMAQAWEVVESSSAWTVHKKADASTPEPAIAFVVYSEKEVDGGGFQGSKAAFGYLCDNGKLSVIFGSVGLVILYYGTHFQLKADDGPELTAAVRGDGALDALTYYVINDRNDPVDFQTFVQNMETVGRFAIRAETSFGRSDTAIFPVAGLGDLFKKYPTPCWSY